MPISSFIEIIASLNVPSNLSTVSNKPYSYEYCSLLTASLSSCLSSLVSSGIELQIKYSFGCVNPEGRVKAPLVRTFWRRACFLISFRVAASEVFSFPQEIGLECGVYQLR